MEILTARSCLYHTVLRNIIIFMYYYLKPFAIISCCKHVLCSDTRSTAEPIPAIDDSSNSNSREWKSGKRPSWQQQDR